MIKVNFRIWIQVVEIFKNFYENYKRLLRKYKFSKMKILSEKMDKAIVCFLLM